MTPNTRVSISKKQIPLFKNAAKLFSTIIAKRLKRGTMHSFNQFQFLAIGLGYKNYPELAFSANPLVERKKPINFFQDEEQNKRIATAFSNGLDYLGQELSEKLVNAAREAEKSPEASLELLIKKWAGDEFSQKIATIKIRQTNNSINNFLSSMTPSA